MPPPFFDIYFCGNFAVVNYYSARTLKKRCYQITKTTSQKYCQIETVKKKCKQRRMTSKKIYKKFPLKNWGKILLKIREIEAFQNESKQSFGATIWHFWKISFIFWIKLFKFDNALVQTLAVVKIQNSWHRKIWKTVDPKKEIMAFNCDFNAPMFVDFDNMDGEENADEFFGKFLKGKVKVLLKKWSFQTLITKTVLWLWVKFPLNPIKKPQELLVLPSKSHLLNH